MERESQQQIEKLKQMVRRTEAAVAETRELIHQLDGRLVAPGSSSEQNSPLKRKRRPSLGG